MTNKTFTDATTGETVEFTQTNADLLEMQTTYRSGSAKPPAHFHPKQREHFEILEGSMTVDMNGEQRVYHVGESFDVPQGIPHAMWNAGDVTTRVIWQVRPALKSPALFEMLWGLRQEGKVSSTGMPNLLQVAVLLQAYEDELRMVSPARPVQVILFGVLGFVGRLMGYQTQYKSSN